MVLPALNHRAHACSQPSCQFDMELRAVTQLCRIGQQFCMVTMLSAASAGKPGAICNPNVKAGQSVRAEAKCKETCCLGLAEPRPHDYGCLPVFGLHRARLCKNSFCNSLLWAQLAICGRVCGPEPALDL